jgi:uncharacterized protein (DUF302 family)
MAAFERATVGLFLWWSASGALLDNSCRVVFTSRFDVAETAERIESGARLRGLKVLERTDHTALARRDGYRLQPTQSLLVDGTVGAAPVKLVVWRAHDGVTMVSLDERPARAPRSLAAELPDLVQALDAAAGVAVTTA